MRKSLLIFLILINCLLVAENKANKAFVFYPYLMYSNETNLTFGGYFLYTSRPQGLNMNIPPNSVILNSIYSLNTQCRIYLQPELQVKNGKYSFFFPITYQNWPGSFYGIGNNTKEKAEEDYKSEEVNISLLIKRRLVKNIEFDLFYEMDYYDIWEIEDDGLLDAGNILGSGNCFISGTGFSIIYNNRNNSFYPAKGSYYKFENFFFHEFFGSDYNFSQHKIDLRKFITISEVHILAFQTLFTYTKDEVPFQKLGDLGSKMRGYYKGRYIDNHRLIVRSEYRLFPWKSGFPKRIGFAAFIETGQVAHELEKISFSELKCSGGVGLRFMLIPKEKFNLRIDFAVGKNSTDLILTSDEAF